MGPALPAFAWRLNRVEWCAVSGRCHICERRRAEADGITTFLRESRARSMAGRSALVEAVDGMRVDEAAWRWHEVDSMSFEPDGDPVDAFAYHDGSWSFEDPFGPNEASGQSTNVRAAMLAVQRAHAAHALSVCGSATSSGR